MYHPSAMTGTVMAPGQTQITNSKMKQVENFYFLAFYCTELKTISRDDMQSA